MKFSSDKTLRRRSGRRGCSYKVSTDSSLQPSSAERCGHARSTYQAERRALAVVVPTGDNSSYRNLCIAAEVAIRDAGYSALVHAPLYLDSVDFHDFLSRWRVDGFLVHSSVGPLVEEVLNGSSCDLPVTYLEACAHTRRDTVRIDIDAAILRATESLSCYGHSHFGILRLRNETGASAECDSQKMSLGFEATGVLYESYDVVGHGIYFAHKLALGFAAMSKGARPTVLFCTDEQLVVDVYFGLILAGLRIPQDIELVAVGRGVGGLRKCPGVRSPLSKLCIAGVSMIRDRVEGNPHLPPRHVTITAEYVSIDTI